MTVMSALVDTPSDMLQPLLSALEVVLLSDWLFDSLLLQLLLCELEKLVPFETLLDADVDSVLLVELE